MLTRFFLQRPRFAQVLALIIFISGLMSLPLLPTLEYPDVTPPQVYVNAHYPGATASQVERNVANPIERQINGLDNLLYTSSRSANDGSMSLEVTFAAGTDLDIAALAVQNRVTLAQSYLPQEVRERGVQVLKKNPTQLMFVVFYSDNPEHSDIWLSNYVSLNIMDNLSRLPGVSDVVIFGNKEYSLRIWLDPDRMASLGLTPQDVENALYDQHQEIISGKVGQRPSREHQQLEYVIETEGLLFSPDDFKQVVIRRSKEGKLVRLGDIADVEQGSKDYDFIDRLDNAHAIHLSVYQTPDSNAIEVSQAIQKELEQLSKKLPSGLSYTVPYDSSLFVKETINELKFTLLLTIALVILVIYLFLADWKATLIPAVTIPVSLVGSFTILYVLGYSLNTVTLFGLVLAVGIVVDDAIVVVENVQRQIQENGLPPGSAVVAAMKEVTGPVIATTLVLLAVFFPIGFIPGTSGQFYKEFGIATSSAVMISSICALTLSPSMCALLLKEKYSTGHPLQARLLSGFRQLTDFYLRVTQWCLKHWSVALITLLASIIVVCWQFKVLPGGFIPNDDRGVFFAFVQLPDSHSVDRTDKVLKEAVTIIQKEEEVEHTVAVTGYSPMYGFNASNSGFIAVILKPWSERKNRRSSSLAVMNRVQEKLDSIASANVMAMPPSAIPTMSLLGGFNFKLQDRLQQSPQALAQMLDIVMEQISTRPEIQQPFSTYRATEPRLKVIIDREKLLNQNIRMSSLQNALQSYLGTRYLGYYYKFGRPYNTILQAQTKDRTTPEDLFELYVRSEDGKMVPLKTLVEIQPATGPSNLEHYNLIRSASIGGQAAPGYTTEDAMKAMEAIAEQLPDSFTYEWSGLSQQQLESGQWTVVILLLAILFSYLFLVAQFESWLLPIAVMASIPISLAGALLALYLSGMDNNIYAQLGMVLLIGLAAKNAILIVEFARHREQEGNTVFNAARMAARLRFRAVTMTGLSFILGVLPLMLASGAGATARISLGLPVFWGMLTVAILSTLLTPVYYLLIRSVHIHQGKGR
ncbi:efflux RND transporter permease subunit [Endozoicomonas lisbonensis]|uniref:Efflux pump membrane transporter n=1 Tax=Endozoicomonas lisbonensis TaxID=3120522 RepID=A0ABV2SMD1_9GAMM